MELKKIMALAMVVFLAIPNLTMVRADDPEDGAGLADAIDRARLYLEKIRTSAADLATEHEENEYIQGYLNEINELLYQNGEEDPENLLETTGEKGNEDRVRINMPSGTVLNDIVSISWDYYLYYGYAPHVDIILENDALVFEWAYNDAVGIVHHTPSLTMAWYTTFDDGTTNGPAVIDDYAMAWATTGASGPLGGELGDDNFWFASLADWKTGITFDSGSGSKTIDGDTPVLALEFEVDNWIVQTKAVINNIKMNDDVIYNFEEETEDLGAEGFLVQASAYLAEGDIRSAARCLASARNILGRVKGLLTSMIKVDKVARTERFVQQFKHRIDGLEDKIHRLRGRFGEGKANNAAVSMGLALGRLGQLGADVSLDNVDMTLDGLCDIIEDINTAIDALGGDTSDILEAMDRLEAKIRVLKASSERLAMKGSDTSDVDAELNHVMLLLEAAMTSLVDDDTVTAEELLEQAEDLVKEAGSKIQGISKDHRYKRPKK